MPRVLHRVREPIPGACPVHVTIRMHDEVPSLRSRRLVREVQGSLAQACERGEFRVAHYSLQRDHAHLIVEARGKEALARGMKSVGARLARAVNRVFARSGPVLDGRFEVKLASGENVVVRTVFALLKERLAAMPPEKASEICGTPPPAIRELAARLGHAKSAAMVTSSNMDKYYHGNLMERSQALVFALTGNFGKKGSGFVGFPWLDHDAIDRG